MLLGCILPARPKHGHDNFRNHQLIPPLPHIFTHMHRYWPGSRKCPVQIAVSIHSKSVIKFTLWHELWCESDLYGKQALLHMRRPFTPLLLRYMITLKVLGSFTWACFPCTEKKVASNEAMSSSFPKRAGVSCSPAGHLRLSLVTMSLPSIRLDQN